MNRVFFVTKRADEIGGVQKIVKLAASTLQPEIHAAVVSFDEDKASARDRLIGVLTDLFRILGLHCSNRNAVFIYTVTGFQVLIFGLISWMFRKRFFFWEHGDPEFFEQHMSSRVLRKWLYPLSNGVIVLHADFAERLPASSVRKYIIPNPVPEFQAAGCENLPSRIEKVIWLGRVSAEKQPELALAGLRLSALENSDLHHYFICPSALSPLPDMALPENLKIIDGNAFDFTKWFSPTALFLFTSTKEAMPGVIFEAMAMGAGVISTPCTPWINDILQVADLCLIPINACPADVSEAISDFISASQKRNCNFEKRRDFLEKYDRRAIATKWRQLLE